MVGYGALKSVCADNHKTIHQVSALGEQLPFVNNKFGLVYCRQVLHHSEDLGSICHEVARVLVQGGIFIATREHIIDDEDSLKTFLDNHSLHKFTKAESAYRLDEYFQATKYAGMQVKKILLSKDSVINHHPTTNQQIKSQLRKTLRSKFGRLAILIPSFPALLKYYRHRLSMADKTPGRMISFIARKG